MTILRRAVAMAARRLVSDPVVQEKTREFVQNEVVPRVGQAIDRAQPVVQDTTKKVGRAVGDLRDIATDHPPGEDPKGFLGAARKRFLEPD